MSQEATLFPIIGNKERLVNRVADHIQQLIIDKKLAPGVHLPAERDFAEQIGVSRTVVREAIHILAARGLLEIKHGSGTIVRQVNADQISEPLNLLLQTQGFTLDHLHQVRTILEVENARMAALQATEADIASLRRILTEMDQVKADAQGFADKDAEFHTALARTSHNPLMIMLLDSIRGPMQEIRLSVSLYPDLFATVMPDHVRIVEKVAGRDAEGAQQAMQLHLDHARSIQDKFLAQKNQDLVRNGFTQERRE